MIDLSYARRGIGSVRVVRTSPSRFDRSVAVGSSSDDTLFRWQRSHFCFSFKALRMSSSVAFGGPSKAS